MEAFIGNNSNVLLSRFKTGLTKTPSARKIVEAKKSLKHVKTNLKMTSEKKLDYLVKSSLGLSILLFPLVSQAISEVKPATNILDESGSLTKSSVSYLEKAMQKLKETSGTDVYFVSIRSLPFETEPNQYAEELFQKWNLGEKDVVVVLANKIARAGIFYGNGVTSLTKEMTKSIGEETYPFKAKEEQYSSAALDVSNRIVSILSNKGDPGPPTLIRENSSSNFKSAKATEQQRSKYVAIIIILLVVAFVVPMVQFFYYVKDE
mmetsp:Transcript_36672/g.86765  ORF Transcript_36672/g.86765 Transcript_36672/m.86765 type:complete len:263 (+) Transcript_36672:287-1075(+)